VETPISQPNLPDNLPSAEGFTPAQQPESAYAAPGTVLVIPRVMFNYVIIGIVFFALGAVIGGAGINAVFNANSAENQRLIDSAVNSAVDAAIEAGGGAQAAGLQSGLKYDVTVGELDPVLGAPDAPITIIEFSDFKCPYCGRFVKETLEPLMADFEGKIKLVFRDYPILGQASVLGALAGSCAQDQGHFWEFHDLMFADQANLTREVFVQYATDLDMDVETFSKCFDEQQHMTEIQADYVYAQNLGATGTPAFFVNGRFVSGAQPYQVFADVINQELAALNESTPEPSASS
jgi:protein-disulfide isomerase